VTDDPRAVGSNALVTDRFLAHRTGTDGGHAIVVEAIHGEEAYLRRDARAIVRNIPSSRRHEDHEGHDEDTLIAL
jgi:hypothetical protein